jgi:serine/threonine protein kinase
MKEGQIKEFSIKIGQTLQYLHQKGIVLRNLECEGILMSEDTDHGAPRLSSFD